MSAQTNSEKTSTILRMSADLYKRLKVASVERECTIGDVIDRAASEWLQRQAKKAA